MAGPAARQSLTGRWWPVFLLIPVLAGTLYAHSRATGSGPDGAPDRPPAELHGPAPPAPSRVTVEALAGGAFRYLVNGEPQLFIGMGYNPIYRFLSNEERRANYDRDFRILCEAGVNHITGWDGDKGYEQDRFDELTLDMAQQYGLGVVMAHNLPPEGNYRDTVFQERLLEEAVAKIERYKGHPALRMWGVGNEVFTEMPPSMYPAFGRFYLRLIDLYRRRDPNHPVIYREAEDRFVPYLRSLLRSGPRRPWLQYGMNIYSDSIPELLAAWPSHGLRRPLFVTEFGAHPDWEGGRAENELGMWRTIRSYPKYVLGGAPYVWTTEGPEPVDRIWGLMDGEARPVDSAFELLAKDWRAEPLGNRSCR